MRPMIRGSSDGASLVVAKIVGQFNEAGFMPTRGHFWIIEALLVAHNG